jgi:uncharacterized cupredoxin-like copper-binding protein
MLTGTRRLGAAAAAILVAACAVLLGAGDLEGTAAGTGAGTTAALGPGPVTVRIGIRDSHFSVRRLRVHPHTTVRFVIVNHDPIAHEFIIGDSAVHARHENGTEATHPPVPGEVSIPAHQTGETTYELHAPGGVEFACHLPGHFRYGMFGWVKVTDD